ncbi:MAG: molybdopterin-dependent oxidoreductase [Patescibacteria group bacterium]|nr:molybdopterin-dependent oxidoreductase [Patescibacteria group bacterium]
MAEKDKGFCPYCGCGCRLTLNLSNSDNRIEKTLQDKMDPISEGRPCVKGLTVHEMAQTNRLNLPMIRKSKDEELRNCTWDEAFEFISHKLSTISKERLRDQVYFVGSGETTNEANYLLSKLCRSHFKSRNIDSCARLCHASTATAFNRMFGLKAIPDYTMDDLGKCDTYLLVGTDPVEDYPVLYNRIARAKENGAKIITVDVASSSTTAQADLNLKIGPSGILPLIAHLIVRLVESKDISRDARNIKGFADFVSCAVQISKEYPVSLTGISRDAFNNLYSMVNDAKLLGICFGMGLTQHVDGTQNVVALAGLSMLMNAVLFPGRGKVNVQGAGDVGADVSWDSSSSIKVLEKYDWNLDYKSHDGLVLTKALYSDRVKFVWLMATNPSQSMPDLNNLDKSFKKKFIVLQHHHPSRTMRFADVILPCAILTEESGSVTNCERRVRGIFLSKSNYRENTDVVLSFAKFIGAKGFDHKSSKDVFKEMVNIVPGYESLKFGRVNSDAGQLADKTPKFRQLLKMHYEPDHFKGDGKYPYVLTTARTRFHFCTGEGTRHSETLLKMGGQPVVLMNPKDASSLKISNGSEVRLKSSVGEIKVEIMFDKNVEKRVLVAPFHFEKLLVNKLTPLILDPESGTPCYKLVPVKVKTFDI